MIDGEKLKGNVPGGVTLSNERPMSWGESHNLSGQNAASGSALRVGKTRKKVLGDPGRLCMWYLARGKQKPINRNVRRDCKKQITGWGAKPPFNPERNSERISENHGPTTSATRRDFSKGEEVGVIKGQCKIPSV